MASIKGLMRGMVPTLVEQIIGAHKAFSRFSNQPWSGACSGRKRLAFTESRLSILPPAFIQSPSFVLDVGANRGQWISSLMELLPVNEVWIFEPNPDAMKICKTNVGEREGIVYFDLGLGDACGELVLNVTETSEFASLLEPRTEFLNASYGATAAHVVARNKVSIATLDSIVPEARSIDLLKIDVQGFERAVLTGARRVLANTRAVLIEVNLQSHYVGDDTFPALWNQLAEQGFSFWSMSPPSLDGSGKAFWADAVFVK
jgi:FkbM family methyltransferase